MEGQEDEKADVAAKSSIIFCPSKNNMYHVDRRKRQYTVMVVVKGGYFFQTSDI